MSIHRLPGRIAAVMVGAVAILVLAVGVSVIWMTRAMDEQSLRHSSERVRTALANVLGQTRATTLDYAKWPDAQAAIAKGDAAWLEANIGAAATTGDVAQISMLWGGPLAAPLGWSDAGGGARSDILPRPILDMVEAGLAGVPLDAYRGLAFFVWHAGASYALGAARVEATDTGAPMPDGNLARLILGRRLDADFVRGIGAGVLLDGFEIIRVRPSDRPSLPLMGGDARPVAFLAWNTQMAGTDLLNRMLPALAAVTAIAAALMIAAMVLIRRSARVLVLAERRSARAARTDGLTGLLNREAFSAALATPAAAEERAVLFLDLNGFKRVNDSIGHAAGDLLIVAMAQRLDALSGPGCLLARIGGDEFVFVLTGTDAQFQVERLARAVEGCLAQPFEVMGHHLRLGAALGYSVQASRATSGDDLLRQADIAMYEAKRRPGAAVAFSTMIDKAGGDARAMEVALKEALTRPGELSIAYQPIVSIDTGGLARAEALARWTSPTLGLMAPDRFIAVAEQSGLIVELGRQLLALVCDDLAAHPGLLVSVNVSPPQLTAPGFVPDLVAALGRRGVSPDRMEIELTERVIVDDANLADLRIAELHAAGFSIALDDFGTGYSSIGYLDQMTFDTVKIDRSFVTGLCGSGDQMALVNAMILLCHAMRLRVVCEGVETADELAMLRELGCDRAQGYHIGRPMPIDRLIEGWIDGQAPRAAVA